MDQAIALKLRGSIKRHEQLRLKPYADTKNNITIGYGRNLTENGISESESELFLTNDIVNATMELYRQIPWAQQLDDVRKAVLIELTFNMGIADLLQFRKMLTALKNGDDKTAAKELLDSAYHAEVHGRANDLSYSLETGIL